MPVVSLGSVTARDGARLATYTTGPADAPVTVVLAHGWTLDASAWLPQSDALAGAGLARVVRYDQRGHGRSRGGVDPSGWSIDLLGEDLACVLEQAVPAGGLGCDRPIVLGGHSMGGMTVMALAASHPELFGDGGPVGGVLLANTAAGGLDLTLRRDVPLRARLGCRAEKAFFSYCARTAERSSRIRDRYLPGPSGRFNPYLCARYLFGPNPPREAVLHTARLIHECPLPTVAGWFPALMLHDKLDALAALRRVPVDLLAGTHDRLTPLSHARLLSRRLPAARLHIAPHTGHLLPLEHPTLTTRHLQALTEDTTSHAATSPN